MDCQYFSNEYTTPATGYIAPYVYDNSGPNGLIMNSHVVKQEQLLDGSICQWEHYVALLSAALSLCSWKTMIHSQQ